MRHHELLVCSSQHHTYHEDVPVLSMLTAVLKTCEAVVVIAVPPTPTTSPPPPPPIIVSCAFSVVVAACIRWLHRRHETVQVMYPRTPTLTARPFGRYVVFWLLTYPSSYSSTSTFFLLNPPADTQAGGDAVAAVTRNPGRHSLRRRGGR